MNILNKVRAKREYIYTTLYFMLILFIVWSLGGWEMIIALVGATIIVSLWAYYRKRKQWDINRGIDNGYRP